jgi:hypothetical protein
MRSASDADQRRSIVVPVAATVLAARNPGIGASATGAPSETAVESAAATFSLPPVATFPASAGIGSALESSACRRNGYVASGRRDRMSAAAPATCGDAIDVPSIAQYPSG